MPNITPIKSLTMTLAEVRSLWTVFKGKDMPDDMPYSKAAGILVRWYGIDKVEKTLDTVRMHEAIARKVESYRGCILYQDFDDEGKETYTLYDHDGNWIASALPDDEEILDAMDAGVKVVPGFDNRQ
jgi:hypothetical protein